MTDGRSGLRFLVPCCGQAAEMKWLADQGHEVVGIEGVGKACEDFYKNNNLQYSVIDIHGIPGGKLFKGESSKVEIYNSNLFTLNEGIVGHFDAIIDRGAFVVIDFSDRSRYTALMRSVAKPKCKILLAVQEYDWNERPIKGSPRPVSKNDVNEFYGEWCVIEEIGRKDMLKADDLKRHKVNTWGSELSSHFSVQYLLQVI
ncbi:putative thiopurine S-methyltransferase [Holothuria leucospilota]|uniref:thiopurine S-methyltransferase n=1 Tax=Holothuria leucospilota TaxID=206669 RepID=A0A9Q1CHK2_HOLLE|nr:putative thiopurine S-methyltransferase [Holothuria leucospilota]